MTYLLNRTDATAGVLEEWRREDVDDTIVNLFPLDTPAHQILEPVPISHYKEQPIDWFNDIQRTSSVFDAADLSSNWNSVHAKPEGHTYSDETEEYGEKLISCVAEIQGKQFSVSDSNRNEPMYGMTDRYAYEALKKTQSTVNDFEMSFWWSPGSLPTGADLNTNASGDQRARQTQGIVHWIAKSGLQRTKRGLAAASSFTDGHGNEFGTDGGVLNDNMSYCYDANGLPLDQSMLKNDVLAQWWKLTGRQAGAVGFCGSRIKDFISTFGQNVNGALNERRIDAAARRIIDTIDFYETDFGTVAINLCRYLDLDGQSVSISQDTGSVTVPYDEVLVFIQPRYWQIGVKRPVYMSPLGKTGDFEQGLVRGEKGLLCRAPLGGVGVVNCVP